MEGSAQHWASSPKAARLVRWGIFIVPIIGAWVVVRLCSGHLYRPDHSLGVGLWALQALAIASATSLLIGRIVTRFLPLASLLGLSLTFPDQAPSRFGIALRTGTIRKLEAHLNEASERGLDASESVAARQAIELVTLLARHERLTRGHTERVRAYSDLIAVELGIDAEGRQRLAWAALLHDIGKLTVPSYILNSDGRPTEEEWQILRGHPAAGEAFVEPLADWLGEWRGATSEHHERWDGGGYPRGLAGTEISLAGRIVAAADAYDVITSKRSYKAAMSAEAARTELVRCADTQFDPDVVRALLKVSLDERRPKSILAWLVELLRLDRVAQAVAVAPTAAIIGATSLGTLIGLTGTSGSILPDQLAFVAPAPNFADIQESTTNIDSDVTIVAVPTSVGAVSVGSPTNDPTTTTIIESSSTTTRPGSSTSTTTPGTTSAPAPPGTVPSVTVPGIARPLTSLLVDALPPLNSTTSTTIAPTTTTAPPTGPNARNDVHSTVLGTIGTIPVLGNDRAGSSPLDPATLRIVSLPQGGTAAVSNGNITFNRTALIFVSTSLRYEICDSNGLCDQATVSIVL